MWRRLAWLAPAMPASRMDSRNSTPSRPGKLLTPLLASPNGLSWLLGCHAVACVAGYHPSGHPYHELPALHVPRDDRSSTGASARAQRHWRDEHRVTADEGA